MVDSEDDMLSFSVAEQNCLAELCSIVATQKYFYEKDINDIQPLVHYAEYSKKTISKLESLFECFPNVNWGELYDKFHRQGKNR